MKLRLGFIIISVLVAMLQVASISAQDVQGSFVLVDDTGTLDAEAIELAAQPLVARGAKVGVFLVNEEAAATYLFNNNLMLISGEAGAPMLQMITDEVLNLEDFVDPRTIAIFASEDGSQIKIIHGKSWYDLPEITPEITRQKLKPAIQDKRYDDGYINTFVAIEAYMNRDIPTSFDTRKTDVSGPLPWWVYISLFSLGILLVAGTMTGIELGFYNEKS